jgi:ribosomal protein L22
MSPAPKKPQTPAEGKVDETTAEEAKEAKQEVAAEEAGAPQPEAKPKRARAKKAAPKADEKAAAETGVDKDAAEATEAKPKRTRSQRAGAKNPEGTKPEGADSSAAAGADKATKKAAEKVAGRKRDRRRTPEPGVLVQARARYVRTSARKARLVCDHIRGKDVAEARAILAFTPRAAAKPWLKLLESAVANAEHNHELVGEELKIAAVHADEGPTLKRFRPRAMGRATRIRKRTSHLSITLTPKES